GAALEIDVHAVEVEARDERVEVGHEGRDVRGGLVARDDADVVVGAPDGDEDLHSTGAPAAPASGLVATPPAPPLAPATPAPPAARAAAARGPPPPWHRLRPRLSSPRRPTRPRACRLHLRPNIEPTREINVALQRDEACAPLLVARRRRDRSVEVTTSACRW